MSKYTSMAKDKLSGGREKASGLKDRAKGKVTRHIPGHKSKESEAPTHIAAPISSLRDPNSFAPPPRRTGTGLVPPPPPTNAKRSVVTAPSKYQDPHKPYGELPPKISHEQKLLEAAPEGYDEESPHSSHGYRVDTTGLSTSHLPPPPGRRDGADGRSPSSYESAAGNGMKALPAPAPSLPPRLPPRSNSGSTVRTASPLSNLGVSNHDLNQGAISRLGAAGVSVPAFGIGGSPKPAAVDDAPGPPKPPRPTNNQPPASQLNELQNRFSRLGTSAAGSSTDSVNQPPGQGTTWAQKQAALRTASALQKDPTSVSLKDAKSALGTANNFRQRHGDQVASGIQSANNLNQQYEVADKVGRLTGSTQSEVTASATKIASPVPGLAGKKKPPPPPPKKKPGLLSEAPAPQQPPRPRPSPGNDDGPPPVPMSTRPGF